MTERQLERAAAALAASDAHDENRCELRSDSGVLWMVERRVRRAYLHVDDEDLILRTYREALDHELGGTR